MLFQLIFEIIADKMIQQTSWLTVNDMVEIVMNVYEDVSQKTVRVYIERYYRYRLLKRWKPRTGSQHGKKRAYYYYLAAKGIRYYEWMLR